MNPKTPWAHAVVLLSRWIEENLRADLLLEGLPRTLGGVERARCQHLFFGALRHLGRIEAQLEQLVARPPRPRLHAILALAAYELIEGGEEGHVAKVVHHAVEQTKLLASIPESRLVNAVVRKLAAVLAAQTEPKAGASARELAVYFSHPEWMVARWLVQFGETGTRSLLTWNQNAASVHARWRLSDRSPDAAEAEWLAPTPWPSFYELRHGRWADVESAIADGRIYVQDPSTRLAVELLAPRAGERVLDACAAPGGKSLMMADAMGTGVLVAMDLPGARIPRLTQNLSRVAGAVEVHLVESDLLYDAVKTLEARALPARYDAVLLDVPCSNTGVMRHRVDVKWRLRETDFATHAEQQRRLLVSGARFVAPGGRLVYSTCSLDTAENAALVEAFVRESGGVFTLEAQRIALPWQVGHEGAGAFLLRRHATS